MVKEQNIKYMSKSGYGDSMGYSAKGSKKMAAEYRSKQKERMAKKMKKHKDGTDIPKSKWGARQGNFMKVHPLDR